MILAGDSPKGVPRMVSPKPAACARQGLKLGSAMFVRRRARRRRRALAAASASSRRYVRKCSGCPAPPRWTWCRRPVPPGTPAPSPGPATAELLQHGPSRPTAAADHYLACVGPTTPTRKRHHWHSGEVAELQGQQHGWVGPDVAYPQPEKKTLTSSNGTTLST